MIGFLDFPADGSTVHADVLEVNGWCLFDGSHLARVSVLVNDEPPRAARIYTDRADVAAVTDHPDAPVAGFELLIALDAFTRTQLTVGVVAESLDGEVFRSPIHSVTRVRDDPDVASDVANRVVLRVPRLVRPALGSSSRPDPVRLLVLAHSLARGGAELWLIELLSSLMATTDVTCTIVTPVDGELREAVESLGATVIVVEAWSDLPTEDIYEGHVEAVARIIDETSSAVVLANTLGVFPGVDAALRLGVPVLWGIHESLAPSIFARLSFSGSISSHATKRLTVTLAHATGLVFEAPETAALIVPTDQEHAFVLDYGISTEEIDLFRAQRTRADRRASLGFDDGDLVLVVLGIIQPRKAQATILQAFAALADDHPHLHVVLVGDTPSSYRAAIIEQLRRSACAQRVRLVPVTPDYYEWLEVADVVLNASDVESLPRSLLEAMAFERPIIATDIFGVSTLLQDHATGWLVAPNDLAELVRVIENVLTLSPESRADVGHAARRALDERVAGTPYGEVVGRAVCALADDPSADLTAFFPPAAAR